MLCYYDQPQPKQTYSPIVIVVNCRGVPVFLCILWVVMFFMSDINLPVILTYGKTDKTQDKIRLVEICENKMKREKLDYSRNIGHKTYIVFILWSYIKARNSQQCLKLDKNKRRKNQGRKTTSRVTQDTTIVNVINLLKLIFNMKNEST